MQIDQRITFGVELEWADVDRRIEIDPSLGSWDFKDYTIVNSNGRANDPTGEYPIGGEINTRPTNSVDGQVEIIKKLSEILSPVINYRCNLHIHVGIKGFPESLESLKSVARYLRDGEEFVYEFVEPIPKPSRDEFQTKDDFMGAMKRYRRRLVSHHHSVPDARWKEMMESKTIDEFMSAHAPLSKNGTRAFHITPRAGMNLRSLEKHGTIEYRHFPGSSDHKEIKSCLEWAGLYTTAALGAGWSPAEIYNSQDWNFPQFKQYNHALETGYQRTKYK
jgi:hypothetical protein